MSVTESSVKVILLVLVLWGSLTPKEVAARDVAGDHKPPVCPEATPAKGLKRPGKPPIEVVMTKNCDSGRIEPFTARIELGPTVPDRWRIVQALGYEEQWLNPYRGHNPLKGDLPVYGDDWFFSLTAISDTLIEPRRFPLPVGIATTLEPGRYDIISESRSLILNQQLVTEFVFYKGDTTFKPPDWEFRFIPVFNFQRVSAEEVGVLRVVPDRGGRGESLRIESTVGIQGLFADKHLWNVSDRYDFDSLRVGIQPFTTDFRGFLFQDQQPGVRLFGTRRNNLLQYNVAWFRRLEKHTNNGLNKFDFDFRSDDVFVANLYWQDLITLGHTAQVTVVYNRNREKGQLTFDDNGFIARPASLFAERFARDYDVTYLGFNTDGHIRRINLTTSAYFATGEQTNEQYRNTLDEIKAFFAAFEIGFDDNWIRYRISGLYASGDDDPYDGRAKGFDAIFENPLFAGADTSFWIRQAVPLIGGGAVGLSGRNGVLNSLRSSKEQGQSNFINPGTQLLGIGVDVDVSPETRLALNVNGLWFENTSVLSAARNQGSIDNFIGTDISLALTWRPFMIQNVVMRVSGAALIPGRGYEQLMGRNEDLGYSVLFNLVLSY